MTNHDPSKMMAKTQDHVVTFKDDSGFSVVVWTDEATPRIMAQHSDPEDPWGGPEPTSLRFHEITAFIQAAQQLTKGVPHASTV